MKTKVISAFPACGKTYCFENKQSYYNGILDSDSSEFSWIKDENGNNTDVRNPDFPNNYIKHIKDNMGKVEIIFVSSHDVVRDALKENDIEYTLVYPDINQKDEWIRRFKNRGNNDGFINFISNNWDNFITDMENETHPRKIKLPYYNKKYIDTDILKEILSTNENVNMDVSESGSPYMEKIDYNLIDEECVDMVKFFNDYGLKTYLSCQGHKDNKDFSYYIMFDDCVSDEDIEIFIFPFKGLDNYLFGDFVKRINKKNGKFKYRWIYQITSTDDDNNYKWAKKDLATFKKYHQNKNGLK